MALGTTTYQNSKTSMWEPSYYSRLRIKNANDNLALGFTFWKGTLKVSISEVNTSQAQDNKNNDLAYIHLSPTKARILADCVAKLIEDPNNSNTYGVDTGTGEVRGFIAIGRKNNIPFLFIAKVTSNGQYESSQFFNFNVDYNYFLNIQDIKNLKCQKEYNNNVELQQFHDILDDYARFASGALGASCYDIGRYETAKINNLIRKIAEKTGAIEYNKSNNTNNSNSFFNTLNAENQKSEYHTIDDLERELG